jgi:hypothetical protein
MVKALGDKDRLNAGLEEVEIERRRGCRRLGGDLGGEPRSTGGHPLR